jgi:hypothetical protein
VIIFFKLFEETGDAHHKWLLTTADGIIQQWTAIVPDNPIRSRLGAMSSLLQSVADPTAVSPTAFKDFFSTSSASDSEYDRIGFGNVSFDIGELDTTWFELV